jgi:hypothetical protein
MPKFLSVIAIFLALFISFIVIRFAKDSYRVIPANLSGLLSSTDDSVSIEETNFTNWHEFSPPKGTFKATFPTLPQHASKNLVDPKSKQPRTYDMYFSEKENGSVFMINVITFPEKFSPVLANHETHLKEILDDMLASNPSTKVKNMQFGEYNHSKSLDFSIENDQMTVDAKAFIIGNSLYVISAIAKNEFLNPKEFSFFMQSFHLAGSNE